MILKVILIHEIHYIQQNPLCLQLRFQSQDNSNMHFDWQAPIWWLVSTSSLSRTWF